MKNALNYKGHVLGSLFAFIITIIILNIINYKINYLILLFVCVIYGLLPDIDTQKSKIWKIMSIVLLLLVIIYWSYIFVLIFLSSIIITIFIKHRGFTHTLLSSLILSLPLLYFGIDIFIAGLLSYNSHLILDGHIKFM
jgi:hypothetical protein